MMWHIFRYEWLHIRTSRYFWVIVVILPLLIGYSMHLGQERVDEQLQTMEQLRASEKAFYADMQQQLYAIEAGEDAPNAWWQNPANPLTLGAFRNSGKHVFLDPKPMAALAQGQSDVFTYYGKVNLISAAPLRDNALENPVMQVIGTFDVAFVLVWLLPLFVIVMGYNLLSLEREQGTFALLQSQPVSINCVLVYKLLFRFLLITLLLLFSLSISALITGVALFTSDGGALIIVLMAYTAFWFLLCGILNTFPLSSGVNAVSLAGLWVLFVLLIPAMISIFATTQHPIPSRALWITEQRAIQQNVDSEAEALYESWRADHPEEIADGETPFFYEIWMQRFLTGDEIRKREEEASRKFEEPKQKQSRLVATLRPLSPPLWLQHWLEQRAGTDTESLRSLDDELRLFQEKWSAFFLPRFQRLEFFSAGEIESIPNP